MTKFSPEIKKFTKEVSWTFAKTYAKTWPHEYIVKNRVDETLFLKIVAHIREHGYLANFYLSKITYFDESGMTYWTMVPPKDDPKWYPAEEENIINRCPKENTYEERLKRGDLPSNEKITSALLDSAVEAMDDEFDSHDIIFWLMERRCVTAQKVGEL